MSNAAGSATARFDTASRHIAPATDVAIQGIASRAPLPEFVRLFYALSSLNVGHEPFLVQLVASESGEGTSTVASALAVLSSRECEKPVLLLDCSAGEPGLTGRTTVPALCTVFRGSGTFRSACEQPQSLPGLRVARLLDVGNSSLNMSPREMKSLCDLLRENFAMVVLDCKPVLSCSISAALSRFCDGTVIVVQAERARQAAVVETKATVERFGGQVVGAVFNRRRSYIPEWLHRHL